MAYFDRFDIVDAYASLEYNYNVGGALQERIAWQLERNPNRRKESIGCVLHRIRYRPAPSWTGAPMTDNALEIYQDLQARYGFDTKGAE